MLPPCSWRKHIFCKASACHYPSLVFMLVLSFTSAPPHQATGRALFWACAGMVACSHLSDCHHCPINPPNLFVFACRHRQLRLLPDVASSCPIVLLCMTFQSPCTSVCVGAAGRGRWERWGLEERGIGYTECMWSFMANHMCFWIFELFSQGEGLGRACSMKMGRREGKWS